MTDNLLQSLTTPSAYVLHVETPSTFFEHDLILRSQSVQAGPSTKEQVHESIDDISNECNVQDWDGEGSLPVTSETALLANLLIEKMPKTISAPSVFPDKYGNINFEWHKEPGKALLITINGTGELKFAALLPGKRGRHATDQISLPSGSFSDDLRKYILSHC